MAEDRSEKPDGRSPDAPRWCLPAVVAAALVGLGLMIDTARSISATYDEVAYLRVAARWWRTGQVSEITRMGSPVTFWKLQQAPALWALDRLGRRGLADDPIGRQSELLPVVRISGLWVWLVAFGLTVGWSRRLYGPRAMAFSAWLFALGPNLLAHGSLVTMEMPLVAGTTGTFFVFWRFLQNSGRRDFWAAALLSGVAFSCKFTAVLLPPLLALVWWLELWRRGGRGPVAAAWRVARGMIGFTALMLLADWAVTGFALLPLSRTAGGTHPSVDGRLADWPRAGSLLGRAVEVPIPQDWVGFATQISHQRSGGPSYLFGTRRTTGWWYYYLVALAVKVPLTFWLVFVTRAVLGGRLRGAGRDGMLPVLMAAFLVVTAVGSSRNYGVRYVLPLAPLAIVWVSALAERPGWPKTLVCLGLAGQALAVGRVHPDELTYFNALAGGRIGGRRVLADSNLDWGQGLRALARLQRERPEFRDLTLYYFGDAAPRHYGVVGVAHVVDAVNPTRDLPEEFGAATRYVAVSASLRWGPWGPPGYFRALERLRPVRLTDDTTIAVYRTADLSTSGVVGVH